jgi:transcriptional regulator with XRE-family HTH domain
MLQKSEYFTELNICPEYKKKLSLMNVKEIGERIRRARREAKITQEELANRVGVSQSYVAKLERGGADNPGSQVLMDIAQELKQSAAWLMYGRKELEELDEESIDFAVFFNRLPEDKKQAVRTIIESMKISSNKSGKK